MTSKTPEKIKIECFEVFEVFAVPFLLKENCGGRNIMCAGIEMPGHDGNVQDNETGKSPIPL